MAMPPAIVDQPSLIAAIQDTLNRADLAGAIPVFIQLAEGEINGDDRFRTLASLVRSTATLVPPVSPAINSFIPVPSDYISMQNFRILEVPPPGRIEELTTSMMDIKRQTLPQLDTPLFYTIIGEEMELLPAPDQTYTAQMIYYAEIPSIVAGGTNWMLQRYPHIYYYGALMQAAPYLRNDDRVMVWKGLYEAAAERIKVSNDRGQFSGSPMMMRTPRRYR